MNNKALIKTAIKENVIKNVLVIIIGILIYPIILQSLIGVESGQQTNDFFLVISMLLVTVCFANFGFTYEKCDLTTRSGKIFSHSATFVFILLIAVLLESIVLMMKIVYPLLSNIIFWFAVLLYLGVVLHDFWDLLKSSNK